MNILTVKVNKMLDNELKKILNIKTNTAQHFDEPLKTSLRRGFRTLRLVDLAQKMLIHQVYTNNVYNKLEDLYQVLEKEYNFFYPEHFQPLINKFLDDSAQKRIVFSSPPQHFKTTTALILLIYKCLTTANLKHCYITYSTDRANDVKMEMVNLLQKLKIEHLVVKDCVYVKSFTKDKKLNTYDNKIKFAGAGAAITGYSINGICVIDDVIKNAEEARSPTILNKIWQSYLQDIYTRANSIFDVIVIATRWSEVDLSGRLIKEHNFEDIRFPAICDDENEDPLGRKLGDPLNPNVRPLEILLDTRDKVGDQVWQAMYQQKPLDSTQKPFNNTHLTFTNNLPSNNFMEVIGIDCAYTPGRGDYSVALHLRKCLKTDVIYIVSALREQVLLQDFVKNIKTKWGTTIKMHWYVSASEYGQAGLTLKKEFPNLILSKTVVSKLSRAQNTIKLYNNNKLEFLNNDNIKQITEDILVYDGASHRGSDTVDALVAGVDLLEQLTNGSKMSVIKPSKYNKPAPRKVGQW